MDSISSAIVNIATAQANQQLRTEVGIATLKTALDTQASQAAALIAALPQPAALAASGLGQLVDVYA